MLFSNVGDLPDLDRAAKQTESLVARNLAQYAPSDDAVGIARQCLSGIFLNIRASGDVQGARYTHLETGRILWA